ncbi:dapA [Wigglesworthia glossinidia endosymbiont of Glossina brevipalpis]|uniref:4-hydroxy-tetrahydrodipicolinate synthase n=1 Tax=Wigglesworthia glossinidia brevipalpis TaxID=36870 RepID=DAPA_WIGBR|nr:RecName: Full=4-hydroxy-tetrahydrodipicolinate synthase; Short=HTPA synthase [Wigglesworthia glossinidia endosymbiont of Glossina brevipalpis]BAC24477.1 dapA [Wigglesworthia glossinidia endosymbiont of Glossina brevipalpis]
MFTGSIVALITPMKKSGKIDFDSIKGLIEYHIVNNTSAILAIGTTGENFSLTFEEQCNIVKYIFETCDKKIPVIAGIISSNIENIKKQINFYNKINISGILISTPYYSCPTQNGIFNYFKEISKNTDIPQIIYNNPKRTGCDILPETVSKLSYIKNIIGIKDSSKDLSRVKKIKFFSKKNFCLLCGDDINILDFMQLGGCGVISTAANIIAYESSSLCRLINNRHYYKAEKLYYNILDLYKILLIAPNPTPIKWACNFLGLIKTKYIRLPMIGLNKKEIFMFKKILNKIKLKSKINCI